MQFARENVPYNLDDSEMNRTVPSKIFFSEFSSFSCGQERLEASNRELARRTNPRYD